MRTRLTKQRLLALAAACALVLAACGDDDEEPAASDATSASTVAGSEPATTGGGDGQSLTVGSADFPESQLIAEIYAQSLEKAGVTVERKLNIGSREIYYKAIESGEIQLVPEYTNSLLSYVLRQADPNARPDATTIDEQVEDIKAALPQNLTVLAPSTAEDKDVLVCRQDVAEQHGLTTLSDLAAVAGEITIGAPAEFQDRAPWGLVGFKDIYGAEFKEFVPLDIGSVADALASGAIDCGNLFSTMSVITTEGFVALEDDKTIVPHEAVLPLIAVASASPEVQAVLDPVNASLTTDKLKEMMVKIEVDKLAPDVVAKEYVEAM